MNKSSFQLLVCSGVWTSMFLYGLGVGAPTVYIPQIRKEANSTSIITDEMASWLCKNIIYLYSTFKQCNSKDKYVSVTIL